MKRIKISVVVFSFLWSGLLISQEIGEGRMDIDMGMQESLRRQRAGLPQPKETESKEESGMSEFEKAMKSQERQLEGQLFSAAAKGDDKTVKDLLKKVGPNVRNAKGNTPLLVAKDLAMVKLLVKNGADVNAQNKEGLTRLHKDVLLGKVFIIGYLLSNGADVNLASNKGVTPLHLATLISYFAAGTLGKAFQRAGEFVVGGSAGGAIGGTISAASGTGALAGAGIGEAAVAGAVGGGAVAGAVAGVTLGVAITAVTIVDISIRKEIVTMLLLKGANPNAQDADGKTPLHTLAAGQIVRTKEDFRHAGVFMAKQLILNGASRDIKNNNGEIPYDVAKEYKRIDLYVVLDPNLPRPIEGAIKGVKKGAEAAGREIKKGAEAVGRGVKEGAETVGRGIEKGAEAVGRGVKAGWEESMKALSAD
jgi:ankyrin repeat protein